MAIPPGSRTFQIGSLPLLNTLLYGNSPAQVMAGELFQTLARYADTRNDCRPEEQPVIGMIWDEVPGLDWLESTNQSHAVEAEPDTTAQKPAHQAAIQQDLAIIAVADQAELADL